MRRRIKAFLVALACYELMPWFVIAFLFFLLKLREV